LAPWLLVAAAAPIFAALTWNGAGKSDALVAPLRLFGFPIAAIELFVIAIAYVRGWNPLRQLRFLSTSVLLLLGLLVLAAFFSAIHSAPRPVGAFIWTYLSLIHLMFGLSVAHLLSKSSPSELSLVWPAIVLGSVVYVLMLLAFVNQPHPSDFDWQYLGLAASNVRQLGYYAGIGSLAALACAAQSKGWKCVAFGVAASLNIAVLLWSGSRGALAAVAASILFGIFFVGFRTGRAFGVTVIAGLIGAILSRMQPSPDPVFGLGRIVARSYPQSGTDFSSGRLEMWTGAWDAFLERPFFGYGEGQFGFVVPQATGIYLHPHNIVLQLLIQWGAVGTLIVAILLVMLVKQYSDTVRLNSALARPAAMVAAFLIALSFCDGALFHTYPLMVFSLSISMIVITRSSGIPPDVSGRL
jgi:O-antigen ligase